MLATFNGAPWLEQQLASILAQVEVDVSIVVSDDASTDGTLEQARRQLVNWPRTVYFSAISSSGSASANFFSMFQRIDCSHYDYISLADQDDVWLPDKLIRGVRTLEAEKAAGYSGAVRAFWPSGRSTLLKQVSNTTAADYLFEGAGQGCTFVLTSGFFRQVQIALGRSERLLRDIHYHDWAIYALCRALGHKWHFDERECLRYRQHALNDTGARLEASGILKRLRQIRSGWYGRHVKAIALLCEASSDIATASVKEYLALKSKTGRNALFRLRLCIFVLAKGRRRKADRLFLLWAAAMGYL